MQNLRAVYTCYVLNMHVLVVSCSGIRIIYSMLRVLGCLSSALQQCAHMSQAFLICFHSSVSSLTHQASRSFSLSYSLRAYMLLPQIEYRFRGRSFLSNVVKFLCIHCNPQYDSILFPFWLILLKWKSRSSWVWPYISIWFERGVLTTISEAGATNAKSFGKFVRGWRAPLAWHSLDCSRCVHALVSCWCVLPLSLLSPHGRAWMASDLIHSRDVWITIHKGSRCMRFSCVALAF